MYLSPDRLSSLSDTVYKQSCQPLHFGRSWLRLRALHYAAVLLIISLRSPPQKHFKNIFNLMCVWASTAPATSCECAFFVYVVLVVPYWHPHFKPADQLQCSVGFLLLCVCSWRDYFCFSHFKRPHWSKLPGDKSHQKSTRQTWQEEYVYRKVPVHYTTSVWSAVLDSWDSYVARGRTYDVKQRVSWKHHINEGKAVGSTLNISHFMDCETLSLQHLDIVWVEMLFTNFFIAHNIAFSAAKCWTSVLAHVSRKWNCEGGPCTLHSESDYYT